MSATSKMTLPAPLRWAGLVLAWVVMISMVVILLAALIIPRVAGATPYVIETGSMKPGMPPGTLIVVRPVDPEAIAAGDVITYQIKSGDPTVVTHRVVAVGFDGTGEVRWQTQGDANEAVDQNWVLPVQVQGEQWYTIPYVGYLTSFVTGQQREALTLLVGVSLLGYALAMFRGARRDRRARPEAEPQPQSQPESVPASVDVMS
ncbi:hypothetical protein NSZ01_18640 [Nocardioides szechwanensis]|uniref:Signal peptidase I n=1 Tax=Nocardioides szechwanensis TaxID=1005944 RepID=A0A1H0GXH1_9ACTN|nr:signal peptidase I [Nocardioides szechwanensis]GEP34096.1 hypothetical protein NSZ01_18640 [Nocardioides szechwanensis]SDO11494.1 signal peptidase, endoplasmic reticulum-type [Nocardioides szechwanensis]